MKRNLIKSIHAMQVFDSRANPTVKVKVELEDGTVGEAMVPSGASTGKFEAVELRDDDSEEFNGKGVLSAVENVNKKIAKKLIGENCYNQAKLDEAMIKLDGTSNKSKLGANAILGTSLAIARAAANSLNLSLYRYIGGINGNILPIPMMNILNGGKHSDNNLSIQEFMIVPVGADNFRDAMQMCIEIYHKLKEILKKKRTFCKCWR